MKRTIAGLVMLLVLLGAATALADRYEGNAFGRKTNVLLKTNKAGTPKEIRFGRYQANCDRGYTRAVSPIDGFVPKFDFVSHNRVVDRGHVEGRAELDGVSRKAKFRTSWFFLAHRKPGDRWRGRYRVEVKYTKHGKTVTRCSTHFGFNLKRK